MTKKNFSDDQKIGPWGPKMAIFGQKLRVLAKNRDFFGSKIFKKKFSFNFFAFFLNLKFFLKNLPPKNGPLGPKMAIFGQKHQILAKNGDFFGPKFLGFFSRFLMF